MSDVGFGGFRKKGCLIGVLIHYVRVLHWASNLGVPFFRRPPFWGLGLQVRGFRPKALEAEGIRASLNPKA